MTSHDIVLPEEEQKSILRRRPTDAAMTVISATILTILVASILAIPSSMIGPLFLMPLVVLMMVFSILNLLSAVRFEMSSTGIFLTDRSWSETLRRAKPFIPFDSVHSLHLNEGAPAPLPFVTLLLKSGRSVSLPKVDLPNIIYLTDSLREKGVKVYSEKSPRSEGLEMIDLAPDEA